MKNTFVIFFITILCFSAFSGCKKLSNKGFYNDFSIIKKLGKPKSVHRPEKPPQAETNKSRTSKVEDLSNSFLQKLNLSYDSIFSISNSLSENPGNVEKKNKGWLGITMIEKSDNNAEGGAEERKIVIQYVIESSPAARYGLQKGDIIQKMNGDAIFPASGTSLSEGFAKQIHQLSPGASIFLTVLRDNTEHEIHVTLGKEPQATLIMPKYNISSAPHPDGKDSLLEWALKRQNMLSNYFKVADLVKEKSYDIISYRFGSENVNPFRLGEINYLLHNPLNTPKVAQHLTSQIKKYFNANERDFSRLLNFTAKKIDVDYTPASLFKFPEYFTVDTFVKHLEQLFLKAESIRQEAFSSLSEDEMDFLFNYSKNFLHWTSEQAGRESAVEDEERLLRFLKLTQKVDYKKLFYSSQVILHAFDIKTIKLFKQLVPSDDSLMVTDISKKDVVSGDVILNIKTKIGRIIIGGPGPTIYKKNAAVIIDLGGDDVYYNNAGSSTRERPISILVDLSGNDKYISSQPFVQGSGILGTGILIDLEGDDLYVARSASQGIGVIGSGFLIDLDGDDYYSGKSSVQGLGFMGIGYILEGKGHDRYMAEHYAQGIGLTKGFGAIVDLEGSDYMFAGGKYPDFRDPENATQSFAQGFGLGLRPYKSSVGTSGGIGLVYDLNGNDVYISDYFGQGSSYWYAFGALVDENGNDLYVAGRYSQGAGIHKSIGIVIDKKGNDHYLTTFGVAQGCGHDYGIGVLLDNEGDDFYKGGVLAQGIGNDNGIGIFYDRSGNDRYFSKGDGPGVGKFSDLGEKGSIGLYIDGKGEDSYSSGEKDHQMFDRLGWGLFLDI